MLSWEGEGTRLFISSRLSSRPVSSPTRLPPASTFPGTASSHLTALHRSMNVCSALFKLGSMSCLPPSHSHSHFHPLDPVNTHTWIFILCSVVVTEYQNGRESLI